MLASLLADLVVTLHFAFVLFVVAGGLLVLHRRRWIWLHLPAVAWGVAVELQGWLCPLTDLEIALRRRAGEQGYGGGFIAHYLLPILYPEGLTRGGQLALAAGAAGVNTVVYGWLLLRQRRQRKAERGGAPPGRSVDQADP